MKFVILDKLKNLYIDMVKTDETRQRFMIEYNHVRADVFFFIDKDPFILAFGIIGKAAYFEINVVRGFKVEFPLEPKTYHDIIEGFEINASMSGPFNPIYFLNHINSKFPQTIKATKRATPASLIPYHTDVEDADKRYFIGFKDNTKAGNHVTQKNLEKTQKLMGKQAYKMCFDRNLSTCWGSDPRQDNFESWKKMILNGEVQP